MKRVGVIGLGLMGKPMALNLLKAGYTVTVHNRSRPAVDALAAAGAHTAESPAAVAAASEAVITMLPDSPDVVQVVTGPGGVLEGAHPGTVLIDMSTISATVTQRLAAQAKAQGVDSLDAPVSGGEVGAIQGTLSIMVGGEEAVFRRCRPLFGALGKQITYLGPAGSGQITKAINQIIVALTLEAVSEGLVLGAKAGLPLAKVLEAVGAGAARCWALEHQAPKMLAGDFRPGFFLRHQHKDLGLALETGKALGVPLPATGLAQQLYGACVTAGWGQDGNMAIVKLLERLAEVEARAPEEETGNRE